MDQKALLELGKSFLRFIYFGLLGLVATWLTSLVASGSLDNTHIVLAGQSLPLGFVLTGVIAGVLKAIDRYRHVSDTTSSNGIAPTFLQK